MFTNFVTTLRQFVIKSPQIQPIRNFGHSPVQYRYWTEKRDYIRRYGYDDKLKREGLLAHYGDKRILCFPQYKYYVPNEIKNRSLGAVFQLIKIKFFFSGQRMYGARNEHFSVKMIISIFLAMKICIRLVSCTICQHGFVAPKVMSSNCCCWSVKPLNHHCIQLYDRQNGVTSQNVLIICTNFWIEKQKHQCPKINH